MVEVATEMKSYLKRRRDGSAYAIDGRSADEDADPTQRRRRQGPRRAAVGWG
jgi:hypothetical protein